MALFTVSAARQDRWGLIGVAWLAVTPILSLAMGERAEQFLPWLMTSHILAVGIMLIVLELNGKRGSPRVGATLICVLILVRMFESELSLLIKGLVFIAVAIGFLAFNMLLSRRQKHSIAS